ncbi:Syndecan-3 [Acipenser ruthenus]|uniref:Syndecan n=1 Tax=Acipenser ruthenus TaxID=7906 RepID=A0A662YNT2_ACIRT|nr:Syndecan-3 [Acipenser ruthenus]
MYRVILCEAALFECIGCKQLVFRALLRASLEGGNGLRDGLTLRRCFHVSLLPWVDAGARGTAVIVGGVVGALFAAFLVMLLIYRMKKKDEGSYTLEEPKQATVSYQKPDTQEEFYA